MTRRAAAAGLALGFAATVVTGFVAGTLYGLFHSPGAALVGSFLGAAIAGGLVAIPVAPVVMVASWGLAHLLQCTHASPATSKRAFIVFGGLTGPLLTVASLAALEVGLTWDWEGVPLFLTSAAVGAGAGGNVWRIASTPPPPWPEHSTITPRPT